MVMILDAPTLAQAAAECRQIARAHDAAQADAAGVLVVRDRRGRLVGAYVCDDVPTGQIHDADGPFVPLEEAWQLLELQRACAPRRRPRRMLRPPDHEEVA